MKQRVHKRKPAVFLSVLHAVRINRAVYVNLESVGVIMHLDKFDVFSYPFEIKFLTLNLFGEFLSHFVLQCKQFFLVTALQITKPCHFHIEFHFSLNFRVGGSNRLDFRIRKRCFVDVLGFAHRHIPFFYLRNKPLFVFEYLIGITVERPFRRIGVNANALIHIALTDTAPVTLNKVARTIRRVQVMNGYEPFLHVRSSSALFRAAY